MVVSNYVGHCTCTDFNNEQNVIINIYLIIGQGHYSWVVKLHSLALLELIVLLDGSLITPTFKVISYQLSAC